MANHRPTQIHRPIRLASATLLAISLLCIAGCTEPEPEPPTSDAWSVDCNGGQVQTGERGCLHACRDQSDCASDEECRDVGARSKVCWPTDDPMDAGTDTASGRCDSDEIETANKGCLTKCTDDSPCASNESCREVGLSSDVCWPEPTSDAGMCGSDQIDSSTEGCLTICSNDNGCPSDNRKCLEVGLSSKVCWEVAGADKKCSAGKRPLVHGTCVNECSSDDDCMADNDCRKISADSGLCMLWESPDAGMDAGPCGPDRLETANKGCLVKCTSGAACRKVETCRDVGLSSKVCWPDAPTDTGAPDTGTRDTNTTDTGMDVSDTAETGQDGGLTKCTTDDQCDPGEVCRDVGLSSSVCWPTGDTGM